ncbi:HNH endonuclease [Granulicella cerasi]|uniref:Putative HNH nuclease YajD n=1 Tax=Granulicella cerasi TaxID=741063 RepID=A0ABW1Z4S9_9BACT
MASRPNKPCRYPNCSALVASGYCEAHAKPVAQARERWRGTPASRGYDADWKTIRIEALRRDKFLCVHCLALNKITPAQDVDHIIPISVDITKRLDLTNLQSLCRSCHRAKTAHEQKAPV